VIVERQAREDRTDRLGSAVFATFAFLLYAALTLIVTWPLARGLARDLPGDLGDPLFTSWAIAWDATHLGRGWWNANIFAPHPLALAYSEHFLAQALQALPIYALTRNPILCYNLLFLSTFALAGLGMFVFVHELTGSRSAALVGGLAFAFTPYRIASIPHLQVLSSAWMPFVLYGLRRHFDTRRTGPLSGAAAAWIAQNLSCGYYLLFFSPVAATYIAWELSVRRLWGDRRELVRIACACAVVCLATAPLLVPYLELRSLGFNPRSIDETRRFSADVYAYFTADPNLRIWGSVFQAWPRAEGFLFPGLTLVALAALPIAARLIGSRSSLNDGSRSGASGRVRIALSSIGVLYLCVVLVLLLDYSIRLPGLKITSLPRALIVGLGGAVGVLAFSRRARVAFASWRQTPAAFFLLVALFAIAMSFGPDVHARGRTVAGWNVYALFYDHVPGFDGLRVPARFATIASLALAALAGLGAQSLKTGGTWIAGALIVMEALALPIPINQNSTQYADKMLAPLPPAVGTETAPPVYAFIKKLPPSTVLIELPLGEPEFDVRYMFYSTIHWRRLVNGYSGGFPADYQVLDESLKDALSRPARAWDAVSASTATHVVVHESYYLDDRGARLGSWLRSNGAREIAAFDSDHVFALYPR
jgi:hypothetical protein